MNSTRKRFGTVAAGAALALVLAGCGGGDDGAEDTTTPATTATDEQTEDPADDEADETDDAADATDDAEETTDDAGDAGSDAEGEPVALDEFMAMLMSPGEDTLSRYTMEMIISAEGEEMAASGAVDLSGDEPAMQMSMEVPGAGAMEMLMVEGRMFMAMPGMTEEGKFMEVPAEMLGEAGGALDQSDLGSQMEAWEQSAQDVRFLGEEDVNGISTRHYRITVDAAAAMEASGAATGDADLEGMPETITYDVWLDDDNLMRKMAMDMEGIEMEMFANDWGEPVDIQVPAEDDIQSTPGG